MGPLDADGAEVKSLWRPLSEGILDSVEDTQGHWAQADINGFPRVRQYWAAIRAFIPRHGRKVRYPCHPVT